MAITKAHRRPRPARREVAVVLVAATLALAGCSGSEDKSYDIAPIFPLTEDKCATYNGDEEGEGFTASCMVTKEDCERAVADWREAMTNVPDATDFTCD